MTFKTNEPPTNGCEVHEKETMTDTSVVEVSDEVLAGYFNFDSVSGSNEEIPEALESPEVGEKREWVPTLPGKYLNHNRILVPNDTGYKARTRPDGHFGFLFSLSGGLLSKTGALYDTRYPLKIYLDTKPRELSEWENGVRKPRLSSSGAVLMASGISQYLRKFRNEDGTPRFSPKTKSLREIAAMVEESLSLPIGVVVGWQEKSPKNEDGTYVKNYKPKTRAANYLVDGKYLPSITMADGTVFKAQSYVIDFCAVSSVEGQG